MASLKMATKKSVALRKALGYDEDDRMLPHMSQESEISPSSPRIFQSWMAHLRIQTLDDCASESGNAGEDDQHHGSQVSGDSSQRKIPTQNTNARSSGTAGEEHGYELADLKGKRPISQQANPTGDTKYVNHSSITIPEPSDHFCRICGPDEITDDPNNFLVDLGCDCKGSLSMMHRKCALEWFSHRIYVKNDYRCELCMARVDDSMQAITLGAYFSGDSSREVVVRAVSSQARLGNNNVAPPIIFAVFRPIMNSVRTLRRISHWEHIFTIFAVVLVIALFIVGLMMLVKHYWPHLH